MKTLYLDRLNPCEHLYMSASMWVVVTVAVADGGLAHFMKGLRRSLKSWRAVGLGRESEKIKM